MEFEKLIFFFFQAEDGIRDRNVTGVQTCALPILGYRMSMLRELRSDSVGTERLKDSLAADSVAKAVLSTLKLDSALSTRDRGILARYIDDMHSSIKEVSRVLAPKGEAVYIIGENTFR